MKGRVTKTGYRRNSPDVNNDYNIIPSNRISMTGVDFPVLGIDNLGNSELMYPGGEYEFQGDYVTELPAYGSGGLTQWFAEKWVDVKTGKKCGRSGKDKKGRPYPACRPSKRVNKTTPKTSSEMSAAEKAKFKRKKKSGKRINYNHKRAQEGIEVPRTIRYENGKMVLQDKPIYDGMLDEVTVTPYTSSEMSWEDLMNNKATGAIQTADPLFDILTGGVGLAARAGFRNAGRMATNRIAKATMPMYKQPYRALNLDDASSFVTKKPMTFTHVSKNPGLQIDDIKTIEPIPIGRRTRAGKRINREVKAGDSDPRNALSGFYTTSKEAGVRSSPAGTFRPGQSSYKFTMPEGSKVLELPGTSNMSTGNMQEALDMGYDFIKGNDFGTGVEYLPLNKSKMQGFYKEGIEAELARRSSQMPLALPEPVTYYRATTPEKFSGIMNPISTSGKAGDKVENLRFFSPNKEVASSYLNNGGVGVTARMNIKKPFIQEQNRILTNEFVQNLMDQGYDAIQTLPFNGSKNLRDAFEVVPLNKNILTNVKQARFQPGGENNLSSFLPPAIRNMYPKEDPINYGGMLAETTVTAPRFTGPQIRRATETEMSPVNTNFSFVGIDKSGGLSVLKSLAKGLKNIPSKINPKYYNPNTLAKGNPNTMYREVGKDAYEDFVNSGFLRTKSEITDNPVLGLVKTEKEIKNVLRFNKEYRPYQYRHATDFRAPFFSRGKTTVLKKGKPDYLIQTRPDKVGPDKFLEAQWNIIHGNHPPSAGGFGIMDPMYRSADNFDVFKKSWWHGYKPLKQFGGGSEDFRNLDPRLSGGYNSTDATSVNVNVVNPNIANRSRAQRIQDESTPQTVSSYAESSIPEKVLNRLANPFTTAGYVVRGQQIPDRVGSKENVFDMAAEIVNPAAWIDYGTQAFKDYGEGNVVGGTLNAMGALPFIPGSADDLLRTGKIGQFLNEAGSGFKYKKGVGNPYENLKVTDDLFKGPADYGVDYDGQIAKGRLDFVRNLGKELDDAKFDPNWIGPEHLRFYGSPNGRSVVEVAVPGKTHQTQLFYKSSGLAGKSGSGVNGSTQGLWQPYGGHATLLDNQGPVPGWFIKDGGYKDFYNSKSFKDIAGRLDDLTKEAGFDLSGQASKYQVGGEQAIPKRNGVRKNSDGTESTHLMATETLDGKNWFSFPTLFQNEDSTWVDMSNKPWIEAYKEANKRGEVINFGTDKEAAIKFGEGSWKKQVGGQQGPPQLTPGPIQNKVYPVSIGPAEDSLENRIINAKSSTPKSFSRRDALLNASKKVSEGQGGRPLEVLLNMTAVMENSLGDNSKAYGRDYTRSQMSIDDNAYADLFEPRGEYDYTSSQKKGFEWLKGMGYEPAKMDSILRTDDPVAAMATARLVYGRAPGALPNPDSPQEVYSYYMDNYNKSGALKYGSDEKHYKRFLDAYNDLYKKKTGGEPIPVYNTYKSKNKAWFAARKNLGKGKQFMYGGKVYSTSTPKGL